MVRLMKKSHNNESYYIKEGKQVGNLYHVCTLDALVEYIIPENKLEASGKYWNKLLNTKKAISFTRDSLFVVPTDTIRYAHLLFQIVVDGDKLSNKYKITPYQDLNYTGNKPKLSEKEEVVIGPITNFKSYIKEVRWDIKNFNFSDKDIESIEKVINYLGNIPLRRTHLPFEDDYGNIDYKKIKDHTRDLSLSDIVKNNKKKDLIDDATSLLDYYVELTTKDINYILKKYPNILKNINISHLSEFGYKNLEILLKHGLKDKIDDTDKSGETLLSRACYVGNIKLVSLLLKYGANPNIKDKDGYTALLHICVLESDDKNYLNIIKLLCMYGADVNVKNYYNKTPLFYACEGLNIKVVKILLDYNAEVNLKTNDKPLLYVPIANSANGINIMKLLLEHGADPNIRDKYNDTILHNIINEVKENVKAVKELLNYNIDLNVKNNDGCTPLNLACKEEKCNIAKLLISKGADVNIPNDVGKTPIFYAIRYNYIDLIKSLLQAGAEVNIKDVDGDTPLYEACYIGNLNVVKLLLKYGASKSINTKNDLDQSPLFDLNNPQILKLLVNNLDKDTILSKDKDIGVSLLSRSLFKSRPDMFKIYASHKDITKHDIDKVINEKHPYNDESVLTNACKDKNIDMVKEIVKYDVSHIINENDSYGNAPIYYACYYNNKELVKLLLEHGADPNIKNKYGETPLYNAYNNDNEELVKLLLEYGADPNILYMGKSLKEMGDKNKHIIELLNQYIK